MTADDDCHYDQPDAGMLPSRRKPRPRHAGAHRPCAIGTLLGRDHLAYR